VGKAAVQAISSRQHPFIRQCRALARQRDAASGDILLDGVHLIADALSARVPILAAAATLAVWQRGEGAVLARRLDAAGARVYEATDAVLEAASPVRAPTGIVAIGRLVGAGSQAVFAAQPALVVCAVHVQDPGNVGAIVRAGEAAGATGVITTDGSADPFGWKALRGAMGSAFRLPVSAAGDASVICAEARARAIRILATSPEGGTDLHEIDLTGPVMLLVGGEGAGLPDPIRALADAGLRIPMRPPVESLNVAVAAGIALYALRP
jgi:TrmH family RNA methyltransferase